MGESPVQRGATFGSFTLTERVYKGAALEAWRATGGAGGPAVLLVGSGPALAREAALLGSIDHAAVVRVEADHSAGDPPWVQLDWPQGRSIRDALRPRPLKVVDALGVTRELAGLLAHVHARGIFGPDLRASTVCLTEAGPVTTDWSGAFQAGASTLATEVPPALTDIAALGRLLHAMLTGGKGDDGELDPGEAFADPVRALVRELTGPVEGRPRTAREVSYRVRGLLGDAEALRDAPAPKVEFTPRDSMMRGPSQLGPPPPPVLYGVPVTPVVLSVAAMGAILLGGVALAALLFLYSMLSG